MSNKMDEMIEPQENTEVDEATVPAAALSVYSDEPTIDASDLFIPKLRLAQGLTAEVQSGEARPGQWLVLGSNPMTEAEVVVVGMTKRRELRDDDSRTTVCKAPNGTIGIGNPGGNCADCPMAKWQKKPGSGKNSPPECSFIYSYMVYLVEEKAMAILEFARTSVPVGKMLNTMLVQKGVGKFSVRLGSVSKSSNRGDYFSPTIAIGNATEEELDEALRAASLVK